MTWTLAAIFGVHGLIHLMGFAKAFGYAELPQLTQPISPGWGLAWLVAAALLTASAVTFGLGARGFWVIGAIAVVASQIVIVSAWRDAWAGTLANALLLAVVAHGWLTEGPSSFRAQFQRDAAAGLARNVEWMSGHRPHSRGPTHATRSARRASSTSCFRCMTKCTGRTTSGAAHLGSP